MARIAGDDGRLGLPPDKAIDLATVLGGIAGLAVSATMAALVLAMAQIELNTREVARYYGERRKNEAVIDRATNSGSPVCIGDRTTPTQTVNEGQ